MNTENHFQMGQEGRKFSNRIDTTLWNIKNEVHDEIKRRINSGNFSCT
jgi:hypothetical protein